MKTSGVGFVLIDLHTHTDESDGTTSPPQLIEEALAAGLEALAICDHDTFAGYERAEEPARQAGLELVCGIELSTRFHGRSVHLLGYFVDGPPPLEFRRWLDKLQHARRERNERLAERLRALGLDVSLEEVTAAAAGQTGRPHFAQILIQKGYAPDIEQAFRQFLGESGIAYVPRAEPVLSVALDRLAAAGAISSLAHPVRLARRAGREALEPIVAEMRALGLRAIEAYHSDHAPPDVEQYLELAAKYGLGVTGGSDFHGANKPRIRLGRGLDGNLDIPRSVLDRLRVM